MNIDVIHSLVDGRQFAPPSVYPANLSIRNVIVGVNDYREVRVLEIYIPDHGFLYYSVSDRPLKESKFGVIVIGVNLQMVSDQLIATTEPVTIKISNIRRIWNKLSIGGLENPIHEVATLQLIGEGHPNIMGSIITGANADDIFVVMSYPPPISSDNRPGYRPVELFDFLQRPLSEADAKFVFKQFMIGVEKIHSLNLAHRDLGVENILVHINSDHEIKAVKIIDFGLATRQASSSFPFPSPFYGKTLYMPPEVLAFGSTPGYQMDPRVFDIWACGIILFALVTANPLFRIASTADPSGNYPVFLNGGLPMYLRSLRLTPTLIDLLCAILRVNPLERPTARRILEHPWLNR